MERIDYYDRKECDIIPFKPEAEINFRVEKTQFESEHEYEKPLSRFEIALFYGNDDIEYSEACKDYDAYVINELGFKMIEFIPDGGYMAFLFADTKQADEVKKKLTDKIKELGLENDPPQIEEYTQTICPRGSNDSFITVMDFGYDYCGRCGSKLPEKENWHLGGYRFLNLMPENATLRMYPAEELVNQLSKLLK
jgi:hypothetical protein